MGGGGRGGILDGGRRTHQELREIPSASSAPSLLWVVLRVAMGGDGQPQLICIITIKAGISDGWPARPYAAGGGGAVTLATLCSFCPGRNI